jgi:hypothetical protein
MDTVTRPAEELSDLAYFDARDYRLVVTVDNLGVVTIEHPVGDTATTALARERMIRLAAEIVDEVGPRPVADALGADEVTPADLVRGKGVVVAPPAPGFAVLGCRCGRVLDSRELAWLPTTRPYKAGHVFPRIVCSRCASA